MVRCGGCGCLVFVVVSGGMVVGMVRCLCRFWGGLSMWGEGGGVECCWVG